MTFANITRLAFAAFVATAVHSSARAQEKGTYNLHQIHAFTKFLANHQEDAKWIDAVRDHIVQQGILFPSDSIEQRLYKIGGMTASQVLCRIEWPLLRNGFAMQPANPVGDFDDPTKTFIIDFVDLNKRFGPLSIYRSSGAQDVYISESINLNAGNLEMSDIEDELGFNPKRRGIPADDRILFPTSASRSLTPETTTDTKGYVTSPDDPWLDPIHRFIVDETVAKSTGYQRRDYTLQGIAITHVISELQPGLSKISFAETSNPRSIPDTGNSAVVVRFSPQSYDESAAGIGIVAVLILRQAGSRDIHIVEYYGAPA